MGRKKQVQVIKSKGEISTHGMTIKEWQRTPKQLLSEYCQRSKRPRPLYKNAACNDPERFRTRVILPDPKGVNEKAIVVCTQENYPSLTEAQHATALLALNQVDGERQHERCLPEPYASAWLALRDGGKTGSTNGSSSGNANKKKGKCATKEPAQVFSCEYCDKTFKKEHGLTIHVKREHAAEVEAAEKAAALAAATEASAKDAVEDDMDDSPFDFGPRSVTTTAEAAQPKQEFTISASNRFASQYERRLHQESRDETRRASRRKFDVFKQSNPYAKIFMSEENRQFVENLVKAYGTTKKGPKSTNRDGGDKIQQSKEFQSLTSLGFRAEDVHQAIEHCGMSGDGEATLRLDMHLDWLCLYSPEEYLPKGFDPRGKQMEVLGRKSGSASSGVLESSITLLAESVSHEFDSGKERHLDSIFSIYEKFAIQHGEFPWPATSQHEDERFLDTETAGQMREDEALALDSMFDDGEIVTETDITVRDGEHTINRHTIRVTNLAGVPGSSLLEIIVVTESKTLAVYPNQSPIVLFWNPDLNRHINAQVMVELSKHAHEMRTIPQLYELWDKARTILPEMVRTKPVFRFPSGFNVANLTSETLAILQESDDKTHDQSNNKNNKKTRKRRKQFDNSKEMLADLEKKRVENQTYKEMLRSRAKLPAYQQKDEVLASVRNNQVVLISGETGCGKTTQIPQFILDEAVENGLGGRVNILCTQPRRLAAIGVALRVNDEQAEANIGGTIGYQIRLENKTSAKTRLTFVTTGILLRQLQGDPSMDHVTHVIVDEVHERNVDTDFLLSILKALLPKRPDIKLILMSATMNAQEFCEYFNTRAVVEIPGFVHPVEDLFLEQIISKVLPSFNLRVSKDEDEAMALKKLEKNTDYNLLGALVCQIDEANPDSDGSILVFMSGAAEIGKAIAAIERQRKSNKMMILPLHGALSGRDQSKVFQRAPRGTRKVVVSTNVAETSVTIDDVVFVVDSGKMKETQYDPMNRMSMLVETWVSRNSARQRRGRAGRVRPGKCYKLYTKGCHDHKFAQAQLPEIHRVPLEQLVLQVLASDLGQPQEFMDTLMEPPPTVAVQEAVKLLRDVSAATVDDMANRAALTPLGFHLSKLPMDVRIGKMLIYGSLLHCADQMLTIAAALSVRNPFVSPPDKREEANEAKKKLLGGESVSETQSDHICLLYAYEKWKSCRTESERRNFAGTYFLHHQSMCEIRDLRKDLKGTLEQIGFDATSSAERVGSERILSREAVSLIRACLCAGLYPNVINVLKPVQKFSETAGGTIAMAPEAQKLRMMIQAAEEDDDRKSNDNDNDNESASTSSTKKRKLNRVFIHPSSVNFTQRDFPIPWMVYREKVKTSKVFIRDCTVVPPYSLLMFGGEITVQHERETVSVDGWITFAAQARIGVLVRELRNLLDRLLEKKINDPSIDIGNTDVLQGIKKLIVGSGFS